jgi:hypothetical protein
LEQSLISRRFAGARFGAIIAGEADHRGNLADQLDLETALATRRRVQHDALDERSITSIASAASSPAKAAPRVTVWSGTP